MVVKQEERAQHAAHRGEENTYQNIAEKKLKRREHLWDLAQAERKY